MCCKCFNHAVVKGVNVVLLLLGLAVITCAIVFLTNYPELNNTFFEITLFALGGCQTLCSLLMLGLAGGCQKCGLCVLNLFAIFNFLAQATFCVFLFVPSLQKWVLTETGTKIPQDVEKYLNTNSKYVAICLGVGGLLQITNIIFSYCLQQNVEHEFNLERFLNSSEGKQYRKLKAKDQQARSTEKYRHRIEKNYPELLDKYPSLRAKYGSGNNV
eukprot:g2307.t1